MKKIIKYLLIISICLIAGGIIASIQDAFMYIGSTRIRDDSDSNRIRFNKRIAMEYNAQPFDISSDFTWSTTTGLNFSAGKDSMSFSKINLTKDSISGETIWIKDYTLRRKSYNLYDSTVLIWYYKNSRWSTTAEWYAINTYQENNNTTTIHTLTVSSTPALYTITLPHDGVWRVEAFFNYEFDLDSIVNWGTEDSIIVALETREPPTDNLWIKKIYSPYNTKFGEKGTGYVSIVAPSGISTVGLYAWCTLNAQNSAGEEVKRHLSKVRINYELIQ